METFLSALVIAILIEGTITYLFGESSEEGRRPYIRYSTLIIGIVMAALYQIDLLASLGVEAAWPVIGYVTTGLIIGRGSNYVNDFVSKVRE